MSLTNSKVIRDVQGSVTPAQDGHEDSRDAARRICTEDIQVSLTSQREQREGRMRVLTW